MGCVAVGWKPPDEFDEFRIVRSLGFGATGQVYLAHDTLLERPVAIKFVRAHSDPAARARVIDEARAIARLTHPNVVAIYRVAELAGHPYLVSEYVQGQPLHQLERPMSSRQVLDIALDLTCGLAAAHRRGVLHRDIKPANTILADDGRAKLLDFGLAVVTEAAGDADAAASDGGGADPDATAKHPGTAYREPRGRAATATAEHLALVTDQTQPMPASATATSVVELAGNELQIVGTPIYMAPEIWRGEPATRRSDLYSLGILLYELLAGDAPFRDVELEELANAVQQIDIPRLGDVVPGVEPALAAIVDRLIERDPRARFASADAVRAALEDAAAPPSADADPDGNPYRGLAAFEPAHAALFFGRSGEVRELVDRVRIEPFVVVGGDSGTGKSSLCRAGVLPWLAEHGGWSCVEIVPGRHPVQSLAAGLAPWAGTDEAALAAMLREQPDAAARAIRQHLASEPAAGHAAPRCLLVFVDQLEELLTVAPAAEARAVATAIAALAVRSPSLRVLATARSDFLSRLAMLPELGDEMARGLYFLRPLTGEDMRDVIVRPAAAKGVVFESDALIDTLIAQTEHAPGGLPLLQFTLAELWDARAVTARAIRAAALAALGGVGGALTRHADRVLAGLSGDERDAARRILLRLVTAQGTRTRRSEAELVGTGSAREAERAALEALVHGRVLVANNAQDGAYEIAHEALLTSWQTLQAWLRRDAADHALRDRVEHAAGAWQRMDRAPDLLWGRRSLGEARGLDRRSLAPRELAFLEASAAALRSRRMLGAGLAAMLVIGAVVTGLAIRARARTALDAMLDDQTRAARIAHATARDIAMQRDLARNRALALFDAHRWGEGEEAWVKVEAMAVREEREYRTAAARLESLLLLEPARDGVRDWASDLTFERLARAERDRRSELADELASRLLAYRDGRYHAQLGSEARVELAVTPPGAEVWLERTGATRQRLGTAPLPPLALPTGAVVLAFAAPGHAPARLPVLLERGEIRHLQVALPVAASAPPGMLYVPPGRFLFGSADPGEARRQLFSTVPLHDVATAGYFIARREVTFGDWIAFLDDLPPTERQLRSPRSNNAVSSVTLIEVAPRRWRLQLTPTTRTYTAELGQPLHYADRARRADQDWTKFPVSAVSYEDAVAYARWLDRTHRVPGARLCDEYEWERAARGADGRAFPAGDALGPDDANIDVTYGRAPLAFGPDEVGAHPGGRSPVGADDMAGNVWEWTRSVETPDAPIARGGCWYQGELAARSMNRDYGEPTERTPVIGLRLCATPQ
jgi:eukaryotic-like serine/threonine-protein kinase